MTEQQQWIAVAEALGRGYYNEVGMRERSGYSPGDAIADTHAILHGLACRRCNGAVWKESTGWAWWFVGETGMADTEPLALLAMLKAKGNADDT